MARFILNRGMLRGVVCLNRALSNLRSWLMVELELNAGRKASTHRELIKTERTTLQQTCHPPLEADFRLNQ